MRVAFGATALLGTLTGVGQYTYHLARELQAHREVDLWCFYGRDFEQEVSARTPRISGGLRVGLRRYLPGAYRLKRLAQQAHFDTEVRTLRPDVYHEPIPLPLRFRGPTVITVHDLSWIRYPETHPAERVRAMDRYFEPAMRDATLMLTDSSFIKAEILELFGGDPDRILPVPLGLDPIFRPYTAAETAPALAGLGLEHGRYFLSVGTLEPRKNLQATIQAYAALPPTLRAHYPLVLAGMKGWRTGKMERLLAPLVLSGEVRMLGYLAREDLAQVTAGALTMVYPSLYEGFGLPPLEAMGCGVPPIISTAGSLLEVVGDCGLIVEPHDVNALAAAMTRMVEDPALRAELASRSCERAGSFTWQRCAQGTVDAYGRAAASSR
jgi:O-antigen biosynthesis alpha-1,3-rhamnosyltransferase